MAQSSPSPSRSLLPLILVVLGVALIVGGATWYYLMQSSEAAAQPTPQPLAGPHPEIPRVALKDAKAAFDQKQAVFVDVRGDPYYSQGHIQGALNISLDDLPNRLGELNKNDWIITYCT